MSSNPFVGPIQPADQPGPAQQPSTQSQEPQSEWPHQPSSPSVDLVDNTDELWVFIDLPGFKEEEIQINGDETTILLSAERFSELEEGRYAILQERPALVERRIPLPTAIDIERADASLEDGVCTIKLPKTGDAQLHRIEIRAE